MQASELFHQPNTILLDGGMGTMLQAAGMKLGTRPEDLNIENPELIRSIHAKYAAAGSRVVNANTFGASPHKLADSKYTLEEVITAGIANCKQAVAPYGALVTLDVGPLGELLEPSGTLAFEDAVAEYGRIVRAGVAAGADILYFETFTDLYEMKAALLAAKENSTLPIMASMSFEANGRTFTGCTVESFAATARGLGANAVGINCSLGPKEIFPMAKRLAEAVPGDFPVFVKPCNAGSSVGVSKVKTSDDLEEAMMLAFQHDQKILIERAMVGKEVEVAVMGNDSPEASVHVGEIVPKLEFYDYNSKYYDDTADLYLPARISDEETQLIRQTAVKAFKALGCRGLARVDFFLLPDGSCVLNEPNTLPGFTKISMYPKLFIDSGLSYPEIIDRLITLAIEAQ